MLDFDYQAGYLVGTLKILGISAPIATALFGIFRRWIICHYDYHKTLDTNKTQLEIERLKTLKSENSNVPNMRIDKGTS